LHDSSQQISFNIGTKDKLTITRINSQTKLTYSCLHNATETEKLKLTHRQTQSFYGSSGFCPGLPGWAGTRKV